MLHEDRAEVLADLFALSRDLEFARKMAKSHDKIARIELQETALKDKLGYIDHDAATELIYMVRCAIRVHGENLRATLVEALEGMFVTAQEHADLKAGVKLLAEFRGASS